MERHFLALCSMRISPFCSLVHCALSILLVAMLGIGNDAIVEATTPPNQPTAVHTFQAVDTRVDMAALNPVKQFSSAEKRKEADFSNNSGPILEQFESYWENEISCTPCHSPGRPTRPSKCSCKSDGCLTSDFNIKAGAKLMLHFAEMNHNERINFFIDAEKQASNIKSVKKTGKGKVFWLQGLQDGNAGHVHVCRGTYYRLFGAGSSRIEKIKGWMEKNADQPLKRYQHGLTGKMSNRASQVRQCVCCRCFSLWSDFLLLKMEVTACA